MNATNFVPIFILFELDRKGMRQARHVFQLLDASKLPKAPASTLVLFIGVANVHGPLPQPYITMHVSNILFFNIGPFQGLFFYILVISIAVDRKYICRWLDSNHSGSDRSTKRATTNCTIVLLFTRPKIGWSQICLTSLYFLYKWLVLEPTYLPMLTFCFEIVSKNIKIDYQGRRLTE